MSQRLSSAWEETVNTRVVFVKLPPKIHACVVRKDCYNTIMINEGLSAEGRLNAYRHELEHIRRGDFDSDLTAGEIEMEVHSHV